METNILTVNDQIMDARIAALLAEAAPEGTGDLTPGVIRCRTEYTFLKRHDWDQERAKGYAHLILRCHHEASKKIPTVLFQPAYFLAVDLDDEGSSPFQKVRVEFGLFDFGISGVRASLKFSRTEIAALVERSLRANAAAYEDAHPGFAPILKFVDVEVGYVDKNPRLTKQIQNIQERHARLFAGAKVVMPERCETKSESVTAANT